MLTQLRDMVVSNDTKIYLKVMGFDNLNGIQGGSEKSRVSSFLKP
jgi:hypothetical protein